MRVHHRRVATKRPIQKRVLNSRTLTSHFGVIKWTSMPRWYGDFMMGRIS
jgi:hypothetical protein